MQAYLAVESAWYSHLQDLWNLFQTLVILEVAAVVVAWLTLHWTDDLYSIGCHQCCPWACWCLELLLPHMTN